MTGSDGEAEQRPHSEAALLAAAKKGDPDAFEALVVAYQDTVYGVVFRMVGQREDAEEVASTVFVNAFRAISKFRGECAFSTWLFRIAVNLSKNKLRTYARKPTPRSLDAPSTEEGDPPLDRLESPRRGPERHAEAAELSGLVQASLFELDPADREIILLRDWQRLGYAEIGKALEVPEGTVKSRLSRARTAFKEKLRSFLSDERKGASGV